jgi:GxxExxY protein
METSSEHEHDGLTGAIIGAAIEVHRSLGPGLPESSYERALCIALTDCGLSFTRQLSMPVLFRGHVIGTYRADLVVENRVVVEIKSVERLAGVHQAQLLAYMRVLRMPTGLLINFYGEVLRTGVRRLVL